MQKPKEEQNDSWGKKVYSNHCGEYILIRSFYLPSSVELLAQLMSIIHLMPQLRRQVSIPKLVHPRDASSMRESQS